MPNYSTNYKLNLPTNDEAPDIEKLNENFQKIDETMHENAAAIKGIKSGIATITGTLQYNSWVYLDYPEGFSKQNSVIISAFLVADGSYPNSDMSAYITQYVNSILQFELYISGNQNQIGATARAEANNGKNIVVVLMKIS